MEAYLTKARGTLTISDPAVGTLYLRAGRDSLDTSNGPLRSVELSPTSCLCDYWGTPNTSLGEARGSILVDFTRGYHFSFTRFELPALVLVDFC